MGERADRRRTRLVDRKFQFGLAWRLLFVLGALYLAGIVLAFAPSAWILATRKDMNALEPAANEFLVLHQRIWPAMLLSFGGVFAYCLVFSHRVAGPIHRINDVLRQLIQGKYPSSVLFRKKDYFHSTAELLAELSRGLAERNAEGASRPGETGGERERTS